jgi:hypothetical protein
LNPIEQIASTTGVVVVFVCSQIDRSRVQSFRSSSSISVEVKPATTTSSAVDDERGFDIITGRRKLQVLDSTTRDYYLASSSLNNTEATDWYWSLPSDSAGVRTFHGGHLIADDQCLADSLSWRLQNARDDFICPDYHRMIRPPIDKWGPSLANSSGYGDCRDNQDERFQPARPTACCVTPKSLVGASRIYIQTSNLAHEQSFMESFGASYPIGVRVYSHSAIAVSDFDSDNYADVILGNRLFLSRDRGNRSIGDFSRMEGTQIGNRDFAGVWAGDLDGISPDDLVVSYADGSVSAYIGMYDRSARVPGIGGVTGIGRGVGFRWAGQLIEPNTVHVTTVSFVKTVEGYG